MQSPLETPVQALRNTRLVEEICAMDRSKHSISPHDLYARLGSESAPIVVDVRRPLIWPGWTSLLSLPAGTGPMSEMGQSRRFGDVRVTSALPLKADIHRRSRHVSNVPLATSQSKARLRQHPTSWHSRAGGGAVHSIKLGQRRSTSVLKRKTPGRLCGGL
jgi:hypothetical protein